MIRKAVVHLCLLLLLLPLWNSGMVVVVAFSSPSSSTASKMDRLCRRRTTTMQLLSLSPSSEDKDPDHHHQQQQQRILVSRRYALFTTAAFVVTGTVFHSPSAALAYDPDPDPLRESLYLVSRVQEATCLQERYIENKRPPIQKMKLTLRLVDKSYRLLDQVNYISKFLDGDDVVPATQLGNEAADSLQDAIDFVNKFKSGDDENPMSIEQKDYLKGSLTETRNKLFEFLDYLPDQQKLLEARARVEKENELNKDEFDPDLGTDAGVYNPVVLPWKLRQKQ